MMKRQNTAGRNLIALVLIGLGVLFLLGQWGVLSLGFLMGGLWPFFIIAPGLIFLYFAITGSEESAPLIIPGALVTGTGAILFFQNLFDHWESWAYIWTLYPVLLGLGLSFMGRRMADEKSLNVGRSFVRFGGMAFLFFAVLFEIFIFNSLPGINLLIPLALILGGVWMLRGSRSGRRSAGKRNKTNKPNKRTVAPVYEDDYELPEVPERMARGDDLRNRIDQALSEDEFSFNPIDDDTPLDR